jgi:hypothetical protein
LVLSSEDVILPISLLPFGRAAYPCTIDCIYFTEKVNIRRVLCVMLNS